MKKIALALAMFCLIAGTMFAQSSTDLQIVAVVKYNKSESITIKQLKTRVSSYQKQVGRSLTVDEKKKVLDSLIEEKLMLQAAAKAGISIPDSYVDQYFVQNMAQQIGAPVTTEKELNDLVKKSLGIELDALLLQQVGMNLVDYKAYMKSQLLIQQYIVQAKQAEIQKCMPTDEEIKLFYEGNKASFVQSDMMKMFLVLVNKGTDSDAARLKANEFRNKYQDKKITSEQLIAQSNIADSGYQAGDVLLPKTEVSAASLGINYQMLLTLFTQKEGFVSDIIETAQDYRFICINKKYDAKMLSLLDLVQPESTVTVYDYIRSNLTQQKQMQFVQVAAAEIVQSINTPEFVERKKTGDSLDKLLNWGE